MPKAPLEIRKAKEELEQSISDMLFDVISLWQKEHPGWMVTDSDLGIIDVSTKDRQRRIPAASRVEITKTDLTLKICKGGQVKKPSVIGGDV